MSTNNFANIQSLKDSCFNKISDFSLDELTYTISSSSAPFVYHKTDKKTANHQTIFEQLNQLPEELPAALIEKFSFKLCEADEQDLKVFLTAFKRNFFSNNDEKYTQSLGFFFFHRLRQYHSSNLGILKTLFETGIDPNTQLTIYGESTKCPLMHYALRQRYPAEAIEYLLQNKTDCLSKDEKGNLPLHQWISCCDDSLPNHYSLDEAMKILHLFFQHRAKLSDCNAEGRTPLQSAYDLVERNVYRLPSYHQNLIMYNQLPSKFEFPVLMGAIKTMLAQLNYQQRAHNVRKLDQPFSLYELMQKLNSCPKPSGYAPLPKRVVFEKALAEEGKKNGEVTIFKDTDVKIVDDNHEGPLLLDQSTYSEAAACQMLFERIKNGKTCIQWEDSDSLSEKVLSCIKKLLTRPSGRALIYSLVESGHPFFIVGDRSDNGHAFHIGDGFPTLISVDLITGNTEMAFLALGHEFLHARLDIMSKLISQKLLYTKRDGWSNLNEQIVIAGIEGEGFLCENMLRFEFGEPPRTGHFKSRHGIL